MVVMFDPGMVNCVEFAKANGLLKNAMEMCGEHRIDKEDRKWFLNILEGAKDLPNLHLE